MSTRTEQALQTRRRIVAVARDSFLTRGYGQTTIREIAAAAQVSPETIYKTFGNKAALLKTVYDQTLAGDDQDIPMSERPELLAVRRATTPQKAARAYASVAAAFSERIGELHEQAAHSQGSDPDLRQFVTLLHTERILGVSTAIAAWEAAGWLRPGVSSERARDVIWLLISPLNVRQLLQRGWSAEEYVEWLSELLLATVFVDSGRPRRA